MSAIFLIIISFLLPSIALAQSLPIGLYEGLMANSGVALSESKAASYYNPSLLQQRTDNAFSVNGNSIGSINSKERGNTFSSSMNLSPTYLSNILVGESLVHEFFMANTLQGEFSWRSSSAQNQFDANSNINRLVSGYSMAFKSIPFALQVLVRYSEVKLFGFSEPMTTTAPASLAKVESQFKNLNLALGVSSHFRFDHYTFGINFNTRGWRLYEQNEGKAKIFTYGSPGPNDITVTEEDSRASISHEEGRLALGHSFKIGPHELLTDSIFTEQSESLNSYEFIQTFGYRFGDRDGHQLLCGLSHRFGNDVSSLNQNLNTSVGYSWMSGKLRSAIGLYYGKESSAVESSSFGVLFGSEYEY